jgi:hypothetical protein
MLNYPGEPNKQHARSHGINECLERFDFLIRFFQGAFVRGYPQSRLQIDSLRFYLGFQNYHRLAPDYTLLREQSKTSNNTHEP